MDNDVPFQQPEVPFEAPPPFVMPQPKPVVRARPNLTTIQINNEQKAVFDQAFAVFTDRTGKQTTKGAFLQVLAEKYLKIKI